ncbi:MAG: thioesterase family protein [Solirubrobacteraceae bacterium]|nr:thioesterase family protein [Solirubrobacteraceae bacterium]
MSEALVVTPFERDTAVTAAGDGRFVARCEEAWFAPRGPNGGYLAAIVLRALIAVLDAPARAPRSLTLHYLRPPVAGDVEIAVEVQRAGRRLSTLTARLEQHGRLCVLAIGAFSEDFDSAAEYADHAPVVPAPDTIEPAPRSPAMPQIAHRFEVRPAIGGLPFSGGDKALSGGWIAFEDGPQVLDTPALAMLTDAWLPAPFTRLTEPLAAPTIDLTIHFRAPEVLVAEPVLAVFSSRFAHAGFFEEDGELWSADGRLVAQSRQLGLLM